MNVVRYASLQALEEGSGLATLESLLQGIRPNRAKKAKDGDEAFNLSHLRDLKQVII
jgi:hypothetical protein